MDFESTRKLLGKPLRYVIIKMDFQNGNEDISTIKCYQRSLSELYISFMDPSLTIILNPHNLDLDNKRAVL